MVDFVSGEEIPYLKLLKNELDGTCCKSLNLIHAHCMKSVQIRSLFWSVFSRIRTEYGEILRISPYAVQMQENIDSKKLRIWTLFTQW